MKNNYVQDTFNLPLGICFQADIDYTDVPKNKMQAAEILFETVALILGRSARCPISTNVNFYSIGGNSLNSIYTITQLNEKGYYISKFS